MERLFWRFPSDNGTITGSTANARFPVSNLLDLRRTGIVWKTTGVGANEYVEIDLGAEYYVDSFVLLDHNFTNAYSNLTLEGDVSYPLPSSPVLDEPITFRATHLVDFFTTPKLCRYLKFSFTKPSAATIAQASRILMGQHYEVPQSSTKRQWGRKSYSQVAAPRTGQIYVDSGAKPRTLSLDFVGISQAQMEEFDDAQDFGLDYPIIYSLDHENDPVEWLVYGIVTREMEFDQQTSREAWELLFVTGLELTEVL